MPKSPPTAQLPTSNSALLYTVSLFCPPEWQHAERRRFSGSEMRLERGADRSIELFDLLCRALGQEQTQSPKLWVDFVETVSKGLAILDALELHTRTFSATPQQALWVLLAFDVMPALGRTWGFWCLDEALLPQLPDDDLWFLPHPNPENPDRLILPCEAILAWWLDLVEGPIDRIWGDVEDDRIRTLRNWKSGRTTPAISKIMEWFSDENLFSYNTSVETPLTTKQLRSLLLWARAIEQCFKDLVDFLTPGVEPQDADPRRNKALQLLELFRWSHEVTLASHHPLPECEKKNFSEALPYWAKKSFFAAITPDTNGELPRPEHVAQFLSLLLSSLPDNDVLPDIFDDLAARSRKFWMLNIDLKEKREAVQRKINEILEVRESDCPDRQFIVARGIANLRDAPCIGEFFPDLEYLRALNALSSGNFDEAGKHAEKALDLCIGWSIGPLKLDIARLNFSLAVAQDAFNRGSAERSFRILCKSVQPQDADRWKIGEGPIDYSMRLAAADHAALFWDTIVRPYEGVAIETPLQQDSEIISAYTALLFSGASEVEVRDFIKKFRGTLKRKLRDVRGDTFFTVTSKMVPDIARDMRQIPTDPSIPNSPSELANLIAATHLKLVGLLPTDVLDARDYLKQTALMLAAERKDVDMVRALVDRHVDIDAQDVIGRTALHAAARVGADRVFEILLAAGANPTLQTFLGKTPAIFAAEFGRATIFEMRLACTAYQIDKSELKEAYELALDSAKNFKAKRKEYASQGYEIAGRQGFRRIVDLALEKLDK